MDVWFDSGSSWAAVAAQRDNLKYPADMYLEGSDQHRGWFQSSLLTSVANNGISPFKTVLTHGFVLDEKGRKMSKSLGNIIDPMVVMDGGKNQQKDPAYGADVVRLWVSSVDYSSDVLIGPTVLKQLSDAYRKIRNTARYLLSNVHDFDPAKDAVPYAELPELDRYILHRMSEVFGEISESFDRYQFFKFFQTIQNFCIVDLSNFYLDIAKDRLYISAPNSFRRRSCQTVLAIILENLTRAIAPVLCHMAEDIWQYLPYPTPYKSVFEAGWVKLDPQWLQPDLAVTWDKIRDLRTDVNKVMEQARTDKSIGSSLEAKVLLQVDDASLRGKLAELSFGTHTLAQHSPSICGSSPNVTPTPIPSQERKSKTPTIDKLVKSPQIAAVTELLQNIVGTLNGFAYLLQGIFDRLRRSLIGVLVIFATVIALYLGLALIWVIDDLPLLETALQGIGIVVTGVFFYRNLRTKSNRQELFDRIITYRDGIFGTTPTVRKISAVEYSGDLSTIQLTTASVTATIPAATHRKSNGVDELRYLFLASQVELIDDASTLTGLQHQATGTGSKIGVTTAEGQKCDRCWNYSPTVGQDSAQPLICDRCVDALAGNF
jgi:isoleucyl-tRNA synthetase